MKSCKNKVMFTGKSINGKKQDSPTPLKTHMAIKKLFTENHFNTLITTNIDALHALSGIDKSQLFEINGNENKEVCTVCQKEYLRDMNAIRLASTFQQMAMSRICEDIKCCKKLVPTKVLENEHALENLQKPMSEIFPENVLETIAKSDLQLSLDFPIKIDSEISKNLVVVT